MKKGIPILFFFIAFFSFVKAQNLVPNYSFEDTIKCSQGGNQFTGYVANWTGGGGGLCYFNSFCSSNDPVGVPYNALGYQYPRTGHAYAGIYTFIDSTYDPPDANIRDYMQVQLTSTLVASTKYYVTFYVSLADSFKYACNNIGAYFSDSALVWTGYVKPYLVPQVTNNISNSLTDKVNWMKVSGSFIAAGGEQYIIIGNFKNDRHSDTMFVNSSGSNAHIWTEAYYYIDDVVVTTDSLLAGESEPKGAIEEVRVYPNPANTMLNVQLQLSTNETANICLYNNIGEKVKCGNLTENLSTILTSDLSSGIYYYRITDLNGTLIKSDKQVIIH